MQIMTESSLNKILPKQHYLQLRLLDRVLENPGDRFPLGEEAARTYGVNINTARKAFALLAAEGIIERRRKAGSRVLRQPGEEQAATYRRAKDQMFSLLRDLELSGFSALEMIAMAVSALEEIGHRIPRVVYTELDFYELLLGRRELELALGLPVQPRHLDEVERLLQSGALQADLVITTFFCENRLRDSCEQQGVPLVPLRITPPLEQLLNFPLLPRDTQITMVVISPQIRHRVDEFYPHIGRDFPGFKVLTLEEARQQPRRLQHSRILLTQKLILEENRDLFRAIPRIISYNRFQDDEGLDYIREILNRADTTEGDECSP